MLRVLYIVVWYDKGKRTDLGKGSDTIDHNNSETTALRYH